MTNNTNITSNTATDPCHGIRSAAVGANTLAHQREVQRSVSLLVARVYLNTAVTGEVITRFSKLVSYLVSYLVS